jgi:hypothetical protein
MKERVATIRKGFVLATIYGVLFCTIEPSVVVSFAIQTSYGVQQNLFSWLNSVQVVVQKKVPTTIKRVTDDRRSNSYLANFAKVDDEDDYQDNDANNDEEAELVRLNLSEKYWREFHANSS